MSVLAHNLFAVTLDERAAPPRRPMCSIDQVLRTLLTLAESDAMAPIEVPDWSRLLPHTRIDVLYDDGRPAGLSQVYALGPGPRPSPEALMSAESFRTWLVSQGFPVVAPHALPPCSGLHGWVVIAQQSGVIEQSTVMLAASLAHALIMAHQRRTKESELVALRTQLAAAEARRNVAQPALGQTLNTNGALHNLSNLLTVILGHSELLRLEGSPEMGEALAPIIQAARDGQEILQRTMAANGQMVTPSSLICATDISALAAEVLTLTRPLWSTTPTAVELVTSLAPTPQVRVHPTQLREVLTNLILNALNAMPEGGTLTVRSFYVGGCVCLQVSDTGVGIDHEMQSAIFEPYVPSRWGGSGLGLATSRAYIERMGGSIAVESAPGVGTTFTISLPTLAGQEP
jgi:signal transduction histidine kinase